MLETDSVTIDFARVQPAFEAKCEHDGLTVDLSAGLPEDQRDEIHQQSETTLPDLIGDPPAFGAVRKPLNTAISKQRSPSVVDVLSG